MQKHISSFHMRLTPEMLLSLVLLPAILASSCIVSTSDDYQNFSLPSDCRRSCGNINVPYPFGIDRGCSRPGFNLTCVYQNHHDVSAQLYLDDGKFEVTEIDVWNSWVHAKLPVYTLDVGVDSKIFPLSDVLPSRLPYAIYAGNSVFVHGCNVVASIVDLANNSAVIDSCQTFCPEFDSSQSVTYCEIFIYAYILPPLPSYMVKLIRTKQTDKFPLPNPTSIKAFVSGEDGFNDDLITSNIAHVEVRLSWYMGDYASCDVASKDPNKTYACLSKFSLCSALENVVNSRSAGYRCYCDDSYDGNPYRPGGCIDIALLPPPANCSRKCGTVDIPFPFGIENRCHRGITFALVCNTTHNPPDLSFRDWYSVWDTYKIRDTYNISEILLDEGKLRFTKPYVYNTYPFTFANHLASWVIDEHTCAAANESPNFACVAADSVCLDNTNSGEVAAAGYRCKCKDGYRGNPYLEGGCKDIDECKLPGKCYGLCTNTNGSFICTCQRGTIGDPLLGRCIPDKKKNLVIGIIIGASTGIGILLLSIVVAISIRTWKIRKQIKAKENHFRQNHGLLLQQLISSSESTTERTQIFSLEEIEKATNNFDETRVVGRGGHGTVYKGILSDQRVVAIKRSKHMKQSEIGQFINEVAILSQINHRNVVKLFGCCLETQVPLLIYEFISNGTLSDHLHVPNGKSTLSWDDRLRIAAEAAGSLAYLHFAASIPIFHRDVKSSNILLDDHFVAKVSDFGASRFIPLDQTHVVTAIQGTFGYLDPEYYQTSQLTEKSDVYSFGVILLELLTGKKPIYLTEGDTTVNLSMQFLQAVRQHRSFDLVEDHIMEEEAEEELTEIIHLIETCLRLKGVERPTMKEVECKLQELRWIKMKKRGYCIGEGNARDQYFPTASCYPPCESIDQTRQGATRNYSLEREFMWSQSFPR